jgi:hypothetical protein
VKRWFLRNGSYRFIPDFFCPTNLQENPVQPVKKKRPGTEILTPQNGQDPDAAGPPEIKRR